MTNVYFEQSLIEIELNKRVMNYSITIIYILFPGISELPDSIENCTQLFQLDASVNPIAKYVYYN